MMTEQLLVRPRIEVELPRVTADLIINYKNQGIVLINRRYSPFEGFWALPGGHLETGKEDIVATAIREAKEETSLDVTEESIHLLGVYSDPNRDPRGHYLTVAFFCNIWEGVPQALDDAKKIGVFPFMGLPGCMAFDHREIIDDYLKLTRRLIYLPGGGR